MKRSDTNPSETTVGKVAQTYDVLDEVCVGGKMASRFSAHAQLSQSKATNDGLRGPIWMLISGELHETRYDSLGKIFSAAHWSNQEQRLGQREGLLYLIDHDLPS